MKPHKKHIKNQEEYKANHDRDFLILASILFILSFLYFLFPARHITAFQEEQFLFLFTSEYLNEFITVPGGLLVYSGKFLMQFYAFPVTGALILSVTLILPVILTRSILKKTGISPAMLIPLSVLPGCLLILMQNQYFHTMEYNLGFSFILLYFLLTLRLRKFYLNILLFPLLYYIAGAFAFLFAGIDVVYSITHEKGLKRLYNPLPLILLAIVIYFLSGSVFLYPRESLLTWPLPLVNEPAHNVYFAVLAFYLVLLPLVSKTVHLKKFSSRGIRYTALISSVFIIILSGLLLNRMYDSGIVSVIKIQNSAHKGNWDEVIRIYESTPTDNLVSKYFYNTALSENGLLCEKLFAAGQNFGTQSFILPWGDQHLERGAYFFLSAGLVNEAQRWAYEEMVVYGKRPHNMLMLIKTSLLNKDYGMAEKYIGIMKRTAFYRDVAGKYEKMLKSNELILSDPELGSIAGIMPSKGFFIYMETPEDNLPLLFDANQGNKRAFEYMMSWLLLEKDVETVLSNLHLMEGLGYTRIPTPIEEAIMIYYNTQRKFPEMGRLTISRETLVRFDQYFNAFVQARNLSGAVQETMKQRFGNTFWYYYHFQK